MPQTHDLPPVLVTRGPLILSIESVFWHRMRYPRRRSFPARPPLHESASPRELEEPWRVGHGHAFRVPLTRQGVVLGWWEHPTGEPALPEEESERLLAAVGGHIPGVTADDIKEWAKAKTPLLQAFWEAVARWIEAVAARWHPLHVAHDDAEDDLPEPLPYTGPAPQPVVYTGDVVDLMDVGR